jgi:hypothetical protein
MTNRISLTPVLYTGIAVLFIATGLAFGLGFGFIYRIGPPAAVAFFGFAVAFLYPAYWALAVRRALGLRMYRNQALGLALLGIGFALAFVRPLEVVLSYSVLLFYWIDASVLAARRTDPLLRDTLNWSKLRWIFWLVIVGLWVPEMVDLVVSGNFFGNNLTKDIFGTLVVVPFALVFVSGAPLLVLASRRSGDNALKRHLKWFGYFVSAILVAGLLQNAGLVIATFVLFVVGAYCLYRSARSLAPLNRIALDEIHVQGMT